MKILKKKCWYFYSQKKMDLRIKYIFKLAMTTNEPNIWDCQFVKDMNRTEKVAFFKTITPEEKKSMIIF